MARQRRQGVVQIGGHIERAGHILPVVIVDFLRMPRSAFYAQIGDEVGPRLIAVERQQRVVQVE